MKRYILFSFLSIIATLAQAEPLKLTIQNNTSSPFFIQMINGDLIPVAAFESSIATFENHTEIHALYSNLKPSCSWSLNSDHKYPVVKLTYNKIGDKFDCGTIILK